MVQRKKEYMFSMRSARTSRRTRTTQALEVQQSVNSDAGKLTSWRQREAKSYDALMHMFIY